jgi:LysM repeat protein
VSAQVKRRRLLFGAVVLLLLVLLVLPIRAFGGKPVASTVPTAGQEYVVQQGDTLTSIASRVDRADPSSLAQRLAAEVGSNVVVPGEHLLIP